MNNIADFSNWVYERNQMSIKERIQFYEELFDQHHFSDEEH